MENPGFAYEPSAGYLATTFRLQHTAIQLVLGRFAFWMFIGGHIAIKVAYRLGYIQNTQDVSTQNVAIDWNALKVVTAMTTFFEVFYSNESYKRYLRLYDRTREMLGTGYEFTLMTSLNIGRTSMKHVHLANRYYVANTLVFFFDLSGSHVITDRQWSELHRLRILTKEERAILQPLCSRDRILTLMHWCGDVTSQGHALASEKNKVPPNLRASLLSTLFKCRSAQQELTDVVSLPVPFAYFHLLNLMIVVNLSLLAFTMGATESLLSTGVYVCTTLIFMGMMELASELSDPFGTDEVDFPVGAWLTDWYASTVHMLNQSFPDPEPTEGKGNRWDRLLENEQGLRADCWDDKVFVEAGFNVLLSVQADGNYRAPYDLLRLRTEKPRVDDDSASMGSDDSD